MITFIAVLPGSGFRVFVVSSLGMINYLHCGAAERHTSDSPQMILKLAAVGSFNCVVPSIVRARRNLVEENCPVWHQEHLHAVDAAAVCFMV